ncbi:MAG: triose-phosphate isomerase [Actinobacteria bacterium]|nr:triose-phosphate isomerase [Actinomycetota bacterium]MCL6104467.1 triose-phosphate isomerase [Actinomycetota bacterium]
MPLISGNWKMNLSHAEAVQAVKKLGILLEGMKSELTKPEIRRLEAVEISIHPTFVALRSVQSVVEAESIPVMLGAQNCHWEDSGAFTGEVSPIMLSKLNVRYVIVGHSERRRIMGESDEMINTKLKAVFRCGMIPILCVGEDLDQRENNETESLLAYQVKAAVDGVSPDNLSKLVIAYEPVWAIGTGISATLDQAQQGCQAVHSLVGSSARVLYGGSVNADNASQLVRCDGIDGLLVGGASLNPDSFADIVKQSVIS